MNVLVIIPRVSANVLIPLQPPFETTNIRHDKKSIQPPTVADSGCRRGYQRYQGGEADSKGGLITVAPVCLDTQG